MKKSILAIMSLLLILVLAISGCSSAAPNKSADAAASSAAVATTDEAAPAPEAPQEAAEYEDDGAYGLTAEKAEGGYNGESYLAIDENAETLTETESMLTFSLKVDTAAYNNVQRYIESGSLPPHDAVRTEELLNYFTYDAKMKFADDPFAIYTEVGPSPFSPDRHMAFVRVKSKDIDKSELPPVNFTFLIDTSGSMDSYDKLPLLKKGLTMLVETLGKDDRVSIVTYAGSSEIVLDSVSGSDKRKLLSAINKLGAGGSTAGADGINTAFKLAEKNFRENGTNRVILASDGDFNVGISRLDQLESLISEKRDSGVYLSVLGFGTGNIRDDIMETLAKNGNGNYFYINTVLAAQKVLVNELAANLFTIADDVKAQVEFNPANVKSFRLIGYENRALNNRDFNDDTKDAGEIGIGTDVVAMFELELTGDSGLKYAEQSGTTDEKFANELFEVRIRYKNPGQQDSKLMLQPVTLESIVKNPSTDYRFATAVAAFGHLLRDSEYTGNANIKTVLATAKDSLGEDEFGYRHEFVKLLEAYQSLVK